MRNVAFLRSSEMTLVVICVAGVIGLAVASDGNSLSSNSIRVFLQFLAVPVLIGLAQMVVLAVGELNLAVGAMGGVAAVSSGILMADHGAPAPVAMFAGFGVAILAGLANGLLVVLTRISGFVVTLATFTILTGAQYRLVGTQTVSDYSDAVTSFGRATLLDRIPWIFVVACVVAILVSVFLRRARMGREMLATGGNASAAQLSGVSNDRSLVVAHTLSGAIIGVAAMLTVASSPGVNKSIGADWLLPSFAAPIIGGALLTGGSVVVLGTVLAAFVVRLVDAFRAEFQLEPTWVQFLIGAVVLGTVLLGQARKRRRRRALEPHPEQPTSRKVAAP
ncbi:ABC transporter permease [Jiangella alba]|uniref:Autoinducer 2 import system permease protein LsrD n=1 Tax=Jiangella alba TaxID=561176 RepID=A0A1H5J9T6_9ACTN|nr:ABC transporter permease [Jiangella alba]SEE49239.1 monosaccharide ABC transporter membrane protein, CUT2 family [Jiangella alba]